MSTTELTHPTTAPGSLHAPATDTQSRVFLIRGLIAVGWAAAFAATSAASASSVTFGVGALLVAYPLIDAIASLIDARSQHGTSQRLLLANAVTSTAAAAALGLAATGGVAPVVATFGVWALVSGAAQLVVAIRRRAQLGAQWPMRLAGGVSVLFGVAYIIAAAGGNPRLSMIAVYAATGGLDFVLQAWLLARRRRRLARSATPSSTTS